VLLLLGPGYVQELRRYLADGGVDWRELAVAVRDDGLNVRRMADALFDVEGDSGQVRLECVSLVFSRPNGELP
jgi:hypothetical protein